MSDPTEICLLLTLLGGVLYGDTIALHMDAGTQFLFALTCTEAKKAVFVHKKKKKFQTPCSILFQSEKLLMWGLEKGGYMPSSLYMFFWKVAEHGYLTILQSAFNNEFNNCNWYKKDNAAFHLSEEFDFHQFIYFMYESIVYHVNS
jgi:hypothetical protein